MFVEIFVSDSCICFLHEGYLCYPRIRTTAFQRKKNNVMCYTDLLCFNNVPLSMPMNGDGELLVIEKSIDELFDVVFEISKRCHVLLVVR